MTSALGQELEGGPGLRQKACLTSPILNMGSLHDLSCVSGHSCVLRLLLVFLPPPPGTLVQEALRSVGPRVAQADDKVGLEKAFFAIRLVCIVDLNIQDIHTE